MIDLRLGDWRETMADLEVDALITDPPYSPRTEDGFLTLATLGTYGPPNLIHILLDNGAHESTGGQATVSPNVSFAAVAAACGYASAWESDDLDVLDEVLVAPALDGPRFVRLSIRCGTSNDLPRPTLTPVDVKTRLMHHIGRREDVQ